MMFDEELHTVKLREKEFLDYTITTAKKKSLKTKSGTETKITIPSPTAFHSTSVRSSTASNPAL